MSLLENVPASIRVALLGATKLVSLSTAVAASTSDARVGRVFFETEPGYRELDPAYRLPGVRRAGIGAVRADIHRLPRRLNITIDDPTTIAGFRGPGPITAADGTLLWTLPADYSATRYSLFVSDRLDLRGIEATLYNYDYQRVACWSQILVTRLDYTARVMANPPRVDSLIIWTVGQDPPGTDDICSTGSGLGFEIDPNLPLNLRLLNYSGRLSRPGEVTWDAIVNWRLGTIVEAAGLTGTLFVDPNGNVTQSQLGGQWRIVAVGRGPFGTDVYLGNTSGWDLQPGPSPTRLMPVAEGSGRLPAGCDSDVRRTERPGRAREG